MQRGTRDCRCRTKPQIIGVDSYQSAAISSAAGIGSAYTQGAFRSYAGPIQGTQEAPGTATVRNVTIGRRTGLRFAVTPNAGQNFENCYWRTYFKYRLLYFLDIGSDQGGFPIDLTSGQIPGRPTGIQFSGNARRPAQPCRTYVDSGNPNTANWGSGTGNTATDLPLQNMGLAFQRLAAFANQTNAFGSPVIGMKIYLCFKTFFICPNWVWWWTWVSEYCWGNCISQFGGGQPAQQNPDHRVTGQGSGNPAANGPTAALKDLDAAFLRGDFSGSPTQHFPCP